MQMAAAAEDGPLPGNSGPGEGDSSPTGSGQQADSVQLTVSGSNGVDGIDSADVRLIGSGGSSGLLSARPSQTALARHDLGSVPELSALTQVVETTVPAPIPVNVESPRADPRVGMPDEFSARKQRARVRFYVFHMGLLLVRSVCNIAVVVVFAFIALNPALLVPFAVVWIVAGLLNAWVASTETPRILEDSWGIVRWPALVIVFGLCRWLQVRRLRDAYDRGVGSTPSKAATNTRGPTFDAVVEGIPFALLMFSIITSAPFECNTWVTEEFKDDGAVMWILFCVAGIVSLVSLVQGVVELDYRVGSKFRTLAKASKLVRFVHFAYRFSEAMARLFLIILLYRLLDVVLYRREMGPLGLSIIFGVLWAAYTIVFFVAGRSAELVDQDLALWERILASLFVGFAVVVVNVSQFVDRPGYVTVARNVNRAVFFIRCLEVLVLAIAAPVVWLGKSRPTTCQIAASIGICVAVVVHALTFLAPEIRSTIRNDHITDDTTLMMIPDKEADRSEAMVTRSKARFGLSTCLLDAAGGRALLVDAEEEDKMADFAIERILGKGSYGVVALVRQRRTLGGEAIEDGPRYAMKMQNTETPEIGGVRGTFELANRERDLLLKLQHPFIVGLIFYFDELPDKQWKDESTGEIIRDANNNARFNMAIVMEFCALGDLNSYVFRDALPPNYARQKGYPPSKKELNWIEQMRIFSAQLVEAICYLHGNSITFRDLKPQNVLLKRGSGGNLYTVVTDFGLAKQVAAKGGRLVSVAGTDLYAAPEIQLIQEGQILEYTPAVDLYSLGRTLLVMFWHTRYSVKPPELRLPNKSMIDADPRMPPILMRLVDRLCSPIPKERGVAFQLRIHEFFRAWDHHELHVQEIEWEDLMAEADGDGGGGYGSLRSGSLPAAD